MLGMLRSLLLAILCVSCLGPVSAPVPHYDLVVYGGTSGGVVAAVQAKRMGKSVLLIEPTQFLGGLSTGGLGATDIGNKAAIGGIAREFYRCIRKHYADDANWNWQKRGEFKGRGHRPNEDAAWTFEPHVATKIFDEFVREADVPVWFGERLDRSGGVTKVKGRIVTMRCESGRTVSAQVFLDATYEGDLLAAAGVSYRVGREGADEFGERYNSVCTKQAIKHQFTKRVDPWRVPGDPSSGLLPNVHNDGPGEEGSADHRVQAYCFRLCATDVPENRIPWPKPDDYRELDFEILLRNFEAGDLRKPWHPVRMPNRKTDSNNNFAFSTDYLGANYDYPDGDYATRERIIADHLRYTQGLMWTLANHERVPEVVRKHFSRFGLCKDEFQDSDHWPRQLYIREARRMVGEVVMTEAHCEKREVAEHVIGLAAYSMDSHNVQRYVDADGFCRNEGDVQIHGIKPYGIAYGSLTPKRAECTNLLVPVCMSSTHIAFGSIRMEPVFMVLGQSAATAAVMAVNAGCDVQDVDYAKLREKLLADAQVLEWGGK